MLHIKWCIILNPVFPLVSTTSFKNSTTGTSQFLSSLKRSIQFPGWYVHCAICTQTACTVCVFCVTVCTGPWHVYARVWYEYTYCYTPTFDQSFRLVVVMALYSSLLHSSSETFSDTWKLEEHLKIGARCFSAGLGSAIWLWASTSFLGPLSLSFVRCSFFSKPKKKSFKSLFLLLFLYTFIQILFLSKLSGQGWL